MVPISGIVRFTIAMRCLSASGTVSTTNTPVPMPRNSRRSGARRGNESRVIVDILLVTAARARAAGAMASAAAMRQQSEDDEEHRADHDSQDGLLHGAPPIPANPMNAIERQ